MLCMGWVSRAQGCVTAGSQHCRAQRTLCPTNTTCSNRIFCVHNYSLDTGGGGVLKDGFRPFVVDELPRTKALGGCPQHPQLHTGRSAHIGGVLCGNHNARKTTATTPLPPQNTPGKPQWAPRSSGTVTAHLETPQLEGLSRETIGPELVPQPCAGCTRCAYSVRAVCVHCLTIQSYYNPFPLLSKILVILLLMN